MLLKNFFVLVLSVDSLEFQYSSSVPQRTFTSLNKNKLPLYDKQETLQTHKPEPLPPVSWHKYIQKPEKHDPRIGSSYWEANVSFSPMCLLSRPKWFKVPSQLDNWHWRAKNTGTKMRHSFSNQQDTRLDSPSSHWMTTRVHYRQTKAERHLTSWHLWAAEPWISSVSSYSSIRIKVKLKVPVSVLCWSDDDIQRWQPWRRKTRVARKGCLFSFFQL